ncbi:ankyrin repeat-containing domain protein [Mycena capillaripes]|nr:ankyrin repeat-containing domain protein [Mycena capillaripes]
MSSVWGSFVVHLQVAFNNPYMSSPERPKAIRTRRSEAQAHLVQGGHYRSALQAASAQGYKDIVQLLIENSADVNVEGGEYGSALQAASANRHKDIVQLLIENGADMNVEGGEYGSALQAASANRHKDIVRLLIENGADVNVLDNTMAVHFRQI